MFLGSLSRKSKDLFFRSIEQFGSYYQTVKLFSEVQQTPGNKDKLTKIRQFKSSLSQPQKKQFFNLLQWYSRKESVRVSSKIINKYYLAHYKTQSPISQEELAEGGVMKKLCMQDKQSELSLFDVNLFLRYLSSVQGTGSQGEKIKKIIEFGKNVSVLEGIFLLKLIEKKLTIGANKKTFGKMNQKLEEEGQTQQVAVKKTKARKPRSVKQEKSQSLAQLQKVSNSSQNQDIKKPQQVVKQGTILNNSTIQKQLNKQGSQSEQAGNDKK